MFLTPCSPRSANAIGSFSPICSRTDALTQISPGAPSASIRAATLTPSPNMSPSSTITSPRLMPMRKRTRSPSGRLAVRSSIPCCDTPARRRAPTETQRFWVGTGAGDLRLRRCHACGDVYSPPRPFCPACAAREVSVFAASGKGRLYSYVIHHRPVPGFTPPYAIAVVELDEGPRLMTNIVECPQTPEALVLDMPVEAAVENMDYDIQRPLVRPATRQ